MGQKPIKIWGDGVAMYFDLGGGGFRGISIWRGGGSTGWYFDLEGSGYNFDWEGWVAKEHTFLRCRSVSQQ